MTFAVDYAARTDVGLVRSRNEDSGYAGPHLMAVADGMGGHAGGNVASSIVIGRLAPLDGDSHGSDDALTILADAIEEANTVLAREMAADPQLHGMGTTLTALMKAGSHGLALVHIGDSRAYLLRGDVCTQITKDHSFVQTLVDSGRISQAEADHHPQRSLVTRVLTGSPGDEPDLSIREAHRGDRYLICSDGLSDYVAFDTICDVLKAGLDPSETTARLVDLALRGGAPDNVTCVVGDIVPTSADSGTQPVIVGAAAERAAAAAAVPLKLSPAEKAAALTREAVGASTPRDDSGEDADAGLPPRRWRRIAAVTVVVLAALGLAGYGGWRWSQSQYYLADAGGRVAVYRGVPQTLGPIELSSLDRLTDVATADLPDAFRAGLGVETMTSDPAVLNDRLAEYQAQAAACIRHRSLGLACGSGPLPPGTPTTSPLPTASPTRTSPTLTSPTTLPTIGAPTDLPTVTPETRPPVAATP